MEMTNGKSGSALLIVLGMLSFMVVSAVGFAVYMRQSRAPSSHLRRESTARYLLKSALANAISRLDGDLSRNGYVEGVYTDPYPGVGPSQNLPVLQNGDLWTHRVFTPFGLTNMEATVSTLTLEGLAYLPPAVINEARVYSRLTQTAAWRNLSYDLGRYAFTAIDVSDCFDINRLRANERRSSAPGQRVNLSSLFDDRNASELDQVLDRANAVPFVSLADFNILGNGSFTPFSTYIGGGGGSFYNPGDAQYVSNALFIVDTWFPPTNAVGSARNIETHDISAGPDYQPFRGFGMESFLDLAKSGNITELGRELMKNLGIGFVNLYDYLDADQVPLSLALPTVETAPMVCALGMINSGSSQLSPKVEESADGEVKYTKVEGGKEHEIKRSFTRYSYKGIGTDSLHLTGVAAYPFKRVDNGRRGSYRVEAVAAVFMADQGISCRLKSNSPIRPTREDWNGKARDGILFFKGSTQMSIPAKIEKTTDALVQFNLQLTAPNGVENTLYFSIKDEDVTPMNKRDENFTPIQTREFKTVDSTPEDIIVYDADGIVAKANTLYSGDRKDELIKDGDRLSRGEDQNEINFTKAATYRPTVAVWVRIVDGNDTVDMAPAVFADDEDWLQGVQYGSLKDNPAMDELNGGGVPILDFVTDKKFTYSDDATTGFLKVLDGTPATYENWTELYATDPRFNFAPEDWFGKKESGEVTPTSWLTALGADSSTGSGGVFGTGGRDTDLFMFTSDQEYLQSMGELAFLPYLQEMNGTAELIGRGEFNNKSRYHGRNDFNARTWSGIANVNFAWRTYTPVSHNSSGYDPIYELTVNNKPIVSGSGDFRANPFSPDPRVLAAVVKDTPYDYYVASTNTELSVLSESAGASEARRYAFGPNSGDTSARWQDDEIEEISLRLRDGLCSQVRQGKTDWMGAYGNMAWYENGKTGDEQYSFLGSEDLNNPLHGVDRKYLYSFWRECFQNRQQLFLVFIRAEPLTVGGASGDAISNSQLGARGVALVWRDPERPHRSGSGSSGSGQQGARQMSRSQWQDYLKNNGPHRTRVLFYHQFD